MFNGIDGRHLVHTSPHTSPQPHVPPDTPHAKQRVPLPGHPLLHCPTRHSHTLSVPRAHLGEDGSLLITAEDLRGVRDRTTRTTDGGGENAAAEVSSSKLHHPTVGVAHGVFDEAAGRGLGDEAAEHEADDDLQDRYTQLMGPGHPLMRRGESAQLTQPLIQLQLVPPRAVVREAPIPGGRTKDGVAGQRVQATQGAGLPPRAGPRPTLALLGWRGGEEVS